MQNKQHWSGDQLGDFPYRGIRRRSSDQSPEDNTSILVGWLWAALLALATIGVLHLVGWWGPR